MKHTFYTCPNPCNILHCCYCEGDLKYCTVCKGAECELPTDCPGEEIPDDLLKQIGKGEMNFRDGKWEKKDLSSGLFFRESN